MEVGWKTGNTATRCFTNYNNEAVLTTNCDGTLTQYSLNKQKTQWKIKEPNTQFLCAAYKINGTSFVAGDNLGNIRVYDEETKKLIHTYLNSQLKAFS